MTSPHSVPGRRARPQSGQPTFRWRVAVRPVSGQHAPVRAAAMASAAGARRVLTGVLLATAALACATSASAATAPAAVIPSVAFIDRTAAAPVDAGLLASLSTRASWVDSRAMDHPSLHGMFDQKSWMASAASPGHPTDARRGLTAHADGAAIGGSGASAWSWALALLMVLAGIMTRRRAL